MKKPFVTLDQLQEMTKTYPTPFHLYDEKGIRENARKLKAAFAWNPDVYKRQGICRDKQLGRDLYKCCFERH